jgi:hypothetical protein
MVAGDKGPQVLSRPKGQAVWQVWPRMSGSSPKLTQGASQPVIGRAGQLFRKVTRRRSFTIGMSVGPQIVRTVWRDILIKGSGTDTYIVLYINVITRLMNPLAVKGTWKNILQKFYSTRFRISSEYSSKQYLNTKLYAGSAVAKALCYNSEGRGFETRWDEWIFSTYLILPVALGTGVYAASNK